MDRYRDLLRFQSTHSVGSGTSASFCISEYFSISIHPLRGEWDLQAFVTVKSKLPFQSTHSVGSGTCTRQQPSLLVLISIHPLRGEWDNKARNRQFAYVVISIHPLRGEWDISRQFHFLNLLSFQSTHSVGSGTLIVLQIVLEIVLFQSTHSVGSGTTKSYLQTMTKSHFNPPTPWGVGQSGLLSTAITFNFNPPTPWGVGLDFVHVNLACICISIHPLRGEWDAPPLCLLRLRFISIHPLRGTSSNIPMRAVLVISIHPLRGEWDSAGSCFGSLHRFQSTHSVGSGTP